MNFTKRKLQKKFNWILEIKNKKKKTILKFLTKETQGLPKGDSHKKFNAFTSVPELLFQVRLLYFSH